MCGYKYSPDEFQIFSVLIGAFGFSTDSLFGQFLARFLYGSLLSEFIDCIDVCGATGTGKNRKQMIKIRYKFVWYPELPSLGSRRSCREETRNGVAAEYVPNAQSA